MTRSLVSSLLFGPLAAALAIGVAPPAGAAEAVDEALIDAQRALFLEVFEDVERGIWDPVTALNRGDRERLANYLLWPDLRAAYLRAVLDKADPGTVDEYLSEYGTLKPARELRYRYALSLARRDDIDGFRALYDSFYHGRGIERLDCIALRSELSNGSLESIALRAQDLWLIPASQVDECDPLFETLKAEGLIDRTAYEGRYKLAIEARNFTLAHWLAKSIDDEHVAVARRWLAAQSDPERFLERYGPLVDDDTHLAEQAIYAVERLTYDDPIVALEAWDTIRGAAAIEDDARYATDRHIALWTARDRLPGAYELLSELPESVQDAEVYRWQARTSLREGQWERLEAALAQLAGLSAPRDDRTDARDQREYWSAMVFERTGRSDLAKPLLEVLAAERSYYGFLAADAIGAPYALNDEAVVIDEDLVKDLAMRGDLLRARELFRVGLDGRGRSEWDSAVRSMTDDEKYHAAVLAHRWDWHSRAVSTLASIGEYDDLDIRYPLPHRGEFERYSGAAEIDTTWAYGIARSESLFMRDVRSSAGAIGLMQLMPATGRRVARSIDVPYSGLDTLTDPDANIRLGTTYLGQMADRYGGNTILATAAYNAGPHRVDAWLPDGETMDARIWVENIPFNETRRYVRRVLTAQVIFHWRMTGEVRRLSDFLEDIAPRDVEVARR